jgi:hypothetical protein
MTQDEAKAECARRAGEDPDRATHSWIPRESAPGEWSVVRVNVPLAGTDPATSIRADEKPVSADDPRDAHTRNVGPWVGPG